MRVDAAVKSVAEVRSGFEKAGKAEQALVANPDDPQANQAWGEYLCLGKGQWEKGLPFLAKGPDSPLRSVAVRELRVPAEPAAQIEVGDGWWDLAEKEKNPLWKSRLLAHAATFYDAALPQATGLARMKLEKRLAGQSKVNRTGLVAWWRCDEGKGTTVANSAGAGNPATLMNGVEWVPGRLGKALKFDGSSGYLSCRAENLPATNAVQTISFWVRVPVGLSMGQDLLCFSNDSLSGALQAGVSPKGLGFWKFGGTILGKASLSTPDAWHHCAYVLDGKVHAVYVDGKQESSLSVPPQAVTVTNCEFGRYRGVGGGGPQSGALGRHPHLQSRSSGSRGSGAGDGQGMTGATSRSSRATRPRPWAPRR